MKLRPFELALVVIFIGLAFLALFFLSTYKASNDGSDVLVIGTVTVWGTLESTSINQMLNEFAQADDNYRSVTYKYIDPDTFDDTLVNALADGDGPDLLLVSHERLVELRKRISAVSFDSFPIRDIRTAYVDGAQIFALSDGLYAYPVAVDPLVMYWNRNILGTKGFLAPPTTWEELVNTQFSSLIERDFDRTITRAVVALGEYQNVRNAFGVLSALLLQGGTKGVTDQGGGIYSVNLNESLDGSSRPLRAVADFYTRFSRPNNSLYSWNRSFTEDRYQFVSEDLALYFGYASEGAELERLNPNLNFDIAEIPQGASASVRRTYGKFYGISLLKSSKNVAGAAAVMSVLAGRDSVKRIADANHLAPAYRDLLAAGSNDTYGRVAYSSAGVALGWLNPSRKAVDDIFTTMTRDVNENRYDEAKAADDTVSRLRLEYN